MTKAVLCVNCMDVFAPLRDWEADRRWRWCQCDHTGGRWVDGHRGLLEVTSMHGPEQVRVLGLSNLFLEAAVGLAAEGVRVMSQQWRLLHERCAEMVEPHYLFHEDMRDCWAVLVSPGDSGDVTFVDWLDARYPDRPATDSSSQL